MSGEQITVDIGALDALRHTLQQISSGLGDTGDYLARTATDDTVGSGHLADKVHDFAKEWSEGVKKVQGEITEIDGYLGAVADDHRRLEQGLTAEYAP